MDSLIFIAVAGIATALNFIILKWKLERERYVDFALDIIALISLNFLFLGTMTGMTIAMVSSMIFSLYLAVFPPKFEALKSL